MNRRAFGGLVVSCLLAGCSQEDPDDTKTERFVVENRSSAGVAVEIEVLDGGEVVLSGCYSYPPDAGLKFSHEFPWGEYTIRGRLHESDWLERPWNPRSCAPTPHENGNMHAGLVITDTGTPELVINGCDYIKLGGHYIEQYHSPSEFKNPAEYTLNTDHVRSDGLRVDLAGAAECMSRI